MLETLPFKLIPIGSVWVQADDSPNGVIVKELIEETKDVIVQHFSFKNGFLEERVIDWFKLQYRYTPLYSFDGEMNKFMICFKEIIDYKKK